MLTTACCYFYQVGVLPVSLFASGHTFYVQRLAERLGMQPYGVHATFQYSGTPGGELVQRLYFSTS